MQTLNDAAPMDGTMASQNGGSIGLVLFVALLLVGAAGGLLFIGRANAEPYILSVLALLATVGVFLLFALAAGILLVVWVGRPAHWCFVAALVLVLTRVAGV